MSRTEADSAGVTRAPAWPRVAIGVGGAVLVVSLLVFIGSRPAPNDEPPTDSNQLIGERATQLAYLNDALDSIRIAQQNVLSSPVNAMDALQEAEEYVSVARDILSEDSRSSAVQGSASADLTAVVSLSAAALGVVGAGVGLAQVLVSRKATQNPRVRRSRLTSAP